MTGIAGARQRQGSTLENKDFSSGQVWLVQAYSTKTTKNCIVQRYWSPKCKNHRKKQKKQKKQYSRGLGIGALPKEFVNIFFLFFLFFQCFFGFSLRGPPQRVCKYCFFCFFCFFFCFFQWFFGFSLRGPPQRVCKYCFFCFFLFFQYFLVFL